MSGLKTSDTYVSRNFFMTRMFCLFLLGAALAARGEDGVKLTLAEAEGRALEHHPRISMAELSALGAREQVTQARSGFFPQIFGHVTSVGAADPTSTRIAAGGLNNPAIYDRNAEGIEVSQIITDFGRTWNLSESSKLHWRAEQKGTLATQGQVLMELDTAYFGVLQAGAVRQIAVQTVKTRQLLFDQVSTLASNKLKSRLDVSFARVDAEDAKLLLSSANNSLAAAKATLTLMLGEREQTEYVLIETPLPAGLTDAESDFIREALNNRPEVAQARFEEEAARKFARAERDLRYPTISAFAAGGVIPFHDSEFQRNDYGAAGIDLSLPLFTGGRYSARGREADIKTQRAEEVLRDAANTVARDVRVAYHNAVYAKERLDESRELVTSTTEAQELATARYQVGSASIIEVSQAQLNQTAALIQQESAKYGYLTQRSALNFQAGRLPQNVLRMRAPGLGSVKIKSNYEK